MKKLIENKPLIASVIAIFTVSTYLTGVSYGLPLPIPDITAISGQIQSVETAANGAFSALQGLAGTLGYAPGAGGGPLFNPGPGLSEAMATVDKLTADVSNMQEEYQNILINFDKISHLANSVEDAVGNINNLNNQINSAFNQIPQDLTASDVQTGSLQNAASGINSDINYESSEYGNIASAVSDENAYNPSVFVSGGSAGGQSGSLNKSDLENGSALFSQGAIFNSAENSGDPSENINCSSLDVGYTFDSSGNPVGGCTNLAGGFISDTASSGLYNAGLSAARAHKAELEGSEFMNEISGEALKNSSNYYAYQSSILTIMAEENASSLKNLGYMESQLKQIELDKSAEEIKKEHIGSVIMPQTNPTPGLNYYTKTTM
ncbi:MAG: hypothetical protein M0Z57_04900 [Deltaproteobacteria bacterium]|jgi:hypothetical protein|nr:hypothetical protein [Deltaproteobacteria bacterium]